MRIPQIQIKHFGNTLQIRINIPWDDIRVPPAREARQPTNPKIWEDLAAQVLAAYQQHGTISATAKAAGVSYYITQVIVRQEKTRQNQTRRQALKDKAATLATQGVRIEDIAREVGRSTSTVRRWIRT